MNDFHLFTYKKKQFIFSISVVFNLKKKKTIYTYCIKKIYYKISI